MKKLIVALACILCLTLSMTACNTLVADTVAPVINGVKDSTTISLGETFDALAGITASDDVDGDLTSAITVTSMPELTFTDGKATPSMKGAYEITYSVKDKAGNETEEYCTLTVTSKVGTASDYHVFDFSSYDTAEVPTFLNVALYHEAAQANFEKVDGALRLNVLDTGASAGAAVNSVFVHNNLLTNVGSSYKINLYMKSSAPVWFNMIANHSAAGWAPLGSSNWNFNIPGTDVYTKYTISFDAPAAAPADYEGETPYNQVQFFLELGNYNVDGIGVNPTNFTVDILKIEFYEIVGTEYLESINKITEFNASNADVLTVAPAAANTTYEGGKASYNVTSFVEGAQGWEIHLRAKLGVAFETGKKYTIRYKLNADAEIVAGGGICVEDIVNEWQQRAKFVASPVFAVGEGVYEFTFEAEADLTAENSIITWYLKEAPVGQNTATLVLSELEVFEVKGNKTQDKINYHFYPTDDGIEWTCWNDTDDDLGQNGLGSMYYKDGSLFYYIDTISGVDYGNKIFNKSLMFEADCLYKIEVTVKANKNATCWFILNPPTSYDPIISEVFDVTTEAQTFTFATTSEFVVEKDLQLIFSFGSSYNTAGQVEGGLLVEFSSIKVIKLS